MTLTAREPKGYEEAAQIALNQERLTQAASFSKIAEGAYLSECSCKVDSNPKTVAIVLNTTETLITIKKCSLSLEKFYEKRSSKFDDVCFAKNKTLKRICKVFQVNNASNESVERINKVKENIRTEHLNIKEKESLMATCSDFNDIFHLEGDVLINTNLITHGINTEDRAPTFTKS